MLPSEEREPISGAAGGVSRTTSAAAECRRCRGPCVPH
jgi:hypothetical protein